MKKIFIYIFVIFFIFLSVGCKSNLNKESEIKDETIQEGSATISSNGGVVKTPNKMELNIPKNALDEDTSIEIKYDGNGQENSFNSLGLMEFYPSGTTFNKPATVRIKTDEVPDFEELSVYCYDEENEIWDFTTSATYQDGFITFDVTHFSKYEVLNITPEMLEMFTQLVHAASELSKSDSWIIETYRDYLVNDLHIMDYYQKYAELYYYACGLLIDGMYKINNKEGNQEDLIIKVGESNKVGNKYGLTKISNETSSYEKYKKQIESQATEEQEIIHVNVIIDYKMIKPNIDLTATETQLKKGDSSKVYVYCHYYNPDNYFYKDFPLPNYHLTLPYELVNLVTDTKELTTDDEGRASFSVKSKNGKDEVIKVMFYEAGYFGEYSANYINFYGKDDDSFTFSGHIKEIYEIIYNIPLIFTDQTIVEENIEGRLIITIEYDFNGKMTYEESFENMDGIISYNNVDIQVSSQAASLKYKELISEDAYGVKRYSNYYETFEIFKNTNDPLISPVNNRTFHSIIGLTYFDLVDDEFSIDFINLIGDTFISGNIDEYEYSDTIKTTFSSYVGDPFITKEFDINQEIQNISVDEFKDEKLLLITRYSDTLHIESEYNYNIISTTYTTEQTLTINK